MKFGSLPLDEARGGVSVHSIRKDGLVLKKGTLIGDAEIAALRAAGIGEIVVAKLEPGDVSEDRSAREIASAAAGGNVRVDDAFTGRCNLFAESAGVLVVDEAKINRLNRIDEAITFATLPAFSPVEEGRMIATAKIIPFAVPHAAHEAALAAAGDLVRVEPYRVKKVGVISTLLPGLVDKIVEKTLKVTRQRLAPANAEIVFERRIEHDAAALTAAIGEARNADAELILVFGASAIADRRDVIPAAIESAGGKIEHFGMPVDPGNLMLIGEVGGRPVIGAPGCARSPKENGFDWILARMLAGMKVTRNDISALGVGGLLMEIVTRPQPRTELPEKKSAGVAAIVLAAGRSSRMGGPNKLLENLGGRPVVRHVVEAALASHASPVIVVTGHDEARVKAALAGTDVRFVDNPAYADGLSTSVKAGVAALPENTAGAAICLGDMPGISAALLDRMIGAFEPERGALIVVPVRQGRRGNPVLWAKRFFPDLLRLEGDIGARKLTESYAEGVVEFETADDGAFFDIDTPDALAEARKKAG